MKENMKDYEIGSVFSDGVKVYKVLPSRNRIDACKGCCFLSGDICRGSRYQCSRPDRIFKEVKPAEDRAIIPVVIALIVFTLYVIYRIIESIIF